MPGMIQIRHVPDAIHRRLKAKAAMEGMSLSDYLRQEVVEIAARPTVSELRQRLAERSSVRTRVAPAQAVRSERENR
jgi:plasmid stability protein